MFSTNTSRSSSMATTPSRLSTPSPAPTSRQSLPKVLSDKYRLGEELGRGAYGQVYRGMDTRTGQHIAIKQLSLERIPSDSLQGIMNEVELLKNLNHKNIVKYLGSFRSKTHLYIILEYMENGALSSVIKQNKFGPFPEALVAVYTQQVLQGLAYLHDQGVVHRDIKGANILTTKDGVVKLADFGVAAKLGELEAESRAGREAVPVGTPYWMAPEVVEMKAVTTAADIWSVGCLAIELLTGTPPYYELQPMSALYNIVQDPHPPLPPNISMGMQDFLMKCFQKDPSRRPSARELLQHSWITYNRRTLRSSWSRTRGMKARGARTDAHATVSTVVERMLQAETEDTYAVPILEQQQSTSRTLPLNATTPAMQQQQAQQVQALPQFQQQQQQPGIGGSAAMMTAVSAAATAASAAAAVSPGFGSLGPLARATQLRIPPAPAGGSPGTLSDSASSTLVPSYGTFTPSASPSRAGGQYSSGSVSSTQSAEGPLAAGYAAQLPPQTYAQAIQQQQATGMQPSAMPPSQMPLQLQQQAVPVQPPASSQQEQQQPPPPQFPQASAQPSAAEPLSDAAVRRAVSAGSELAELHSCPTGHTLLCLLEGGEGGREAVLGLGRAGAPRASATSLAVNLAAAGGSVGDEELDAQVRQRVVEVQRQVSSMRACAPGERNMVQEAAAAASAKALIGYVRSDPVLKSVFVAADGLSSLLELLDCPSERVLSPALDLLLALVSNHFPSLAASASLGLVPATLRLLHPGPPLDVRLAAVQYLEALCGCGDEGGGVAAMVCCGGVGGLLALVDEEGGSVPTSQHLLMLHIAVSSLWSILISSVTSPSSQLSLNQCLRLMAQQGAAARLVRVLPRVMQERAAALEAWRSSNAVRHHAHSMSLPQTEAELSLLSADSLARPVGTPATIQEEGGQTEPNGGTHVRSSDPFSSGVSPQRLGSTLQTESSSVLRKLRSAPMFEAEQAAREAANPEAEAAEKLCSLLEAIVNLIAVMSHGDSTVKSRMCGADTLCALFSLSSRLDPNLQLRLTKAVHALSKEKEVLGQLGEAETVPWLVAQLGGGGGRRPPADPGMLAEALGALYNLCHLSRSRQEQAAVAGAPAALCALTLASPLHQPVVQALPAATRSLAVSTLCTLAHGGPRTLEELRAAGCIDVMLALLREEAYQESVLDALAVWLDADCARVEQRLLEPAAITRLVSLLPTIATAGDFEALNRLLAPLLRLLSRSPRLAAELAQNGLAPRVMELLKKPNVHTCRSLLAILKAMYENHPRPKEFILKYRVQQTLHALAHGQTTREAVLVRTEARNLLEAFQINLVF